MNQWIKVFLASICALPLFLNGAPREQSLKPHLARLWSHWKQLPEAYQKQKQKVLDDYLTLFTTTNGYSWNDQWTAFTEKMEPEFAPLSVDLIEIMKVAEAYEGCFPNPEEKLSGLADAIFEKIPTNSLVFIHSDLFEATLTIRQQEGRRKDVIILNSARVADSSYLEAALARYPSVTRNSGELGTAGMKSGSTSVAIAFAFFGMGGTF